MMGSFLVLLIFRRLLFSHLGYTVRLRQKWIAGTVLLQRIFLSSQSIWLRCVQIARILRLVVLRSKLQKQKLYFSWIVSLSTIHFVFHNTSNVAESLRIYVGSDS